VVEGEAVFALLCEVATVFPCYRHICYKHILGICLLKWTA